MISEKTADIAQRATAIYEMKLRSHLETTNLHMFVAIQPDSGDYFLGQTLSEAMQASRKSHPDRVAFGIRVEHTVAGYEICETAKPRRRANSGDSAT